MLLVIMFEDNILEEATVLPSACTSMAEVEQVVRNHAANWAEANSIEGIDLNLVPEFKAYNIACGNTTVATYTLHEILAVYKGDQIFLNGLDGVTLA